MRRLNNRGFTLVELLAIIVITALVLGIGTYSVVKLVKNSKKGALTISANSIKESASVYSDEDSKRWLEPYGDDYSYFCVTIEELINKGIIKKDATLPEDVLKTNYVSVKKNKVTLVKGSPVILNDSGASEDEAAYKVCTGNDIKSEDADPPVLGDWDSHTDSLKINFTDGDDDGIKDKWCQYDTTSTISDGKNVIVLRKDDTSCRIDNLKNNSDYYVRVCKTTVGGERRCSLTNGYTTKNFVNPKISYSNLTSKITYDDAGIESGKANHYFKSNISAKSNVNIYECDDSFNCNGSATKNIDKDKWYKVSDKNVTIDYSSSDGIENGVITAKISDGSNYSNDVESKFTLYKVVFKVGSADEIGDGTSDITKRCLSEKGGACRITSPTISKNCYSGMGWSSSEDANSSSWGPDIEKDISSSGTYYPTKGSITTYVIRYDANGGSGAPSNQTKYCGSSITLSNTSPSRTNYNFSGWSSSSGGSVSYYPGSTYSNNSSVTLYAVWSYRFYCSYTGRRYDSYAEAKRACTVEEKLTTSKESTTTTTYSCPSGYTCNSSSCNKYSTCTKTTYGTVTTKYYCSHNSSYQTSSSCSYVGGYYDASYGLNCVESNCSYSCSSGYNGGNGYCYADYASSCPSGWTKVKANGYCNITCEQATQGVSTTRSCTTSGLCSTYSSACCYSGSNKICGNTEHAKCRISAYQYQCSKPATKSGCTKTYSAGSYNSTTSSGSCASGYTASKGSGCTTKINKGGSYYCDTRDYWAGKTCTTTMSTGATVRTDMNCSKTGDKSYYCSITGNYTTSSPSCSETDTTDPVGTPNTTYSCPSGYTEDSSGSCYKWVEEEYSVS